MTFTSMPYQGNQEQIYTTRKWDIYQEESHPKWIQYDPVDEWKLKYFIAFALKV